ncbi:MAG: pentapeptide repeat-containing protein [Polyangiales bacterium]
MSKLTGPQSQQLHEAIVAAFPSRAELARAVRFGLGENLDVVADEGALADVVFKLIQWAEAHGRVDDLITAAQQLNAGNGLLHGLEVGGSRNRAPRDPLFDAVMRAGKLRRPRQEQPLTIFERDVIAPFSGAAFMVPDDPRASAELLALHPSTPTAADVEWLVGSLLSPQLQIDNRTRAKVVYKGSGPDRACIERAESAGVELESFTTFRGLIDFGDYLDKQTAELNNERDPAYPPQMYVPQRMTWRVERQEFSTENALDEVVDWVKRSEGKLLLVLADFGTGKTFLTRKLALALAARRVGVPMMVNMRMLNKQQNLDALLGQHLIQRGFRTVDLDALHYMMDEGGVVLLFDGFDELALRVTYDHAADYLATLTTAVKGRCRVVVTSRTQHFLNEDQSRTALAKHLDAVKHQVFSLQKFDESRIRAFLRNHLAAPRSPGAQPPEGASLEAEVDYHYGLLRDIKDLGGLAETPRMLGMILEIPVKDLEEVKHRAGRITASDLYDGLLTRWLVYEWGRANPKGEAPGMPEEARWHFVTRFAVRLWLQTDRALPLEALQEEAAAIVREKRLKIDPAVAAQEAGSGTLLSQDAEGRFSFLHQSVLEYLVAREAARSVTETGEAELLDKGDMSALMVRFFIEQVGTAPAVRWATSVPYDARTAKQNAARVQTMVDAEFVRIYDFHGQDLREMDLSQLKNKLARAKLSGCNLAGVSLRGFNLRGADLKGANLRGADLTGSDLTNADLSGADLTRAGLAKARMRGVRASEATLERVSLMAAEVDAPIVERIVRAGGVPSAFAPVPAVLPAGGAVSCVAFSRTLDLLALGVGETVWLIDVEARAPLRVLVGHRGRVTGVAFSPDGWTLATSSLDGTIVRWMVMTGEQIYAQRPGGQVRCVAFSPQGEWLASGSSESTVCLWPVSGVSAPLALPRLAGPVQALTFSADGKLLAGGGDDCIVTVWDLESGSIRGTMKGHTGGVTSVAFNQDASVLASGSSDRTVRLWATTSGVELATLQGHDGAVSSVAFNSGGSLLVSAAGDRTVRLWDVILHRQEAVFQGHEAPVLGVDFSPDGKLVASGSEDKTACLWEVSSRRKVATIRSECSGVRCIALSPDGMLATGSENHLIDLWMVWSGKRVASLGAHTSQVTAVAFNHTGELLASGSLDGTLRLWEVSSPHQALYRNPVRELPALATYSTAVTSLAFNSDGGLMICGLEDHTIRVWDTQGRKELSTIAGHSDGVLCVAFSRDGRLASCSGDRTVRVWDVASGRQIAALEGESEVVTCLAFRPDGAVVAGGLPDGTIRLWDVQSGKELTRFGRHLDAISSVAFSPDGLSLASASRDTTAMLWDVVSGRMVAVLEGHRGALTGLAFSHSSLLLATCSADGSTRLWDMKQPGRWVAEFSAVGDGYAVFTPQGKFRTAGDTRGGFWHAVNLCRIEAEDLERYTNLRLGDFDALTFMRAHSGKPPAEPAPSKPRGLTVRRVIVAFWLGLLAFLVTATVVEVDEGDTLAVSVGGLVALISFVALHVTGGLDDRVLDVPQATSGKPDDPQRRQSARGRSSGLLPRAFFAGVWVGGLALLMAAVVLEGTSPATVIAVGTSFGALASLVSYLLLARGERERDGRIR